MRYARRAATLATMAIASALGAAGASPASAQVSGGAQAPQAQLTGGAEYGVTLKAIAPLPHPVVSVLSVPRSSPAGSPPRVTLRVAETGVRTVSVQVAVTSAPSGHRVLTAPQGWVHTGRTLIVHWPGHSRLAAGTYRVNVSVRDHHGRTSLHQAHSSNEAGLSVLAPTPKPPVTPAPAPVPAPSAPGDVSPGAGLPSPRQSVVGAVFPVGGAHNFGGPENRFGAGRAGYTHQGQDVLTTEGTPVVVPLSGTIASTSYQAGGAGYYAVEDAGDGFDLMFAHCQQGSLAVSAGQVVTAGQLLCRAGQTGDATAPHLHFEMWVGGWQAAGGHPIDPLPYLQAWEAG
jgi:murein DD-endopeptidase MepM/ murein hydrolase activator NlpD